MSEVSGLVSIHLAEILDNHFLLVFPDLMIFHKALLNILNYIFFIYNILRLLFINDLHYVKVVPWELEAHSTSFFG